MDTQAENTVNLLIVDDDEQFANLVTEFLDVEGGFAVEVRNDGATAVEAAVTDKFDIIVLDVGLPELNGFEALKQIRQQVDTPVVMLTARGDDIDRILGLEIGADDYIPKPCNLRELVARIRAILRRISAAAEAGSPESSQVLTGDLRLEAGSQSAYVLDKLINLTGAEFRVLETLVTSAGEVVPKEEIARQALGRRIMPYDRRVDTHIAQLRKKLGPLNDGRQRIKTVRGHGYLYVTTSK